MIRRQASEFGPLIMRRSKLNCKSRHGHVVIDGESSSDSAVADVWVRPIQPISRRLSALRAPRNTTTPVNSGHRSGCQQVALPLVGAPWVVLIRGQATLKAPSSTTPSTWPADTMGRISTLCLRYGNLMWVGRSHPTSLTLSQAVGAV